MVISHGQSQVIIHVPSWGSEIIFAFPKFLIHPAAFSKFGQKRLTNDKYLWKSHKNRFHATNNSTQEYEMQNTNIGQQKKNQF